PALSIQKSELLGATKPDSDVAEAWVVPVAVGYADIPGLIVPRAAAHDLVLPIVWTFRVPTRVLLVIVRSVPVLHPLPNIASHIIAPIRTHTCRVRPHGNGSLAPNVGLLRIPLIPPRVHTAIRPSRCLFPFGFSR